MNVTLPNLAAKILGAADSLPDYPFSISYYTNNKRDAIDSYHNCVAPYSIDLLDAFTDRPNGDVEVHANGVLFETFNVGSVTYSIGGRSSSITISGTKQVTNASPVTVPVILAHVVSEGYDSYDRVVLSLVPTALAIRPADSVTYKGDTYTVVATAFGSGASVKSQVITLELVP